MSFLAPKLVLTPVLIASASLAGRRWGAAMTGWLVALPLTSGPIFVFVALELGQGSAVAAAAGSLLGALGQVAFAATYAALARRTGWLVSLVGAALAFGAAVAIVPAEAPAFLFVAALVAAAVVAAWLLPTRSDESQPATPPSRWDIPARALVATVLVVAISGIAPLIGGRAAGILATFPVYVSVLTTFAHRVGGPGQAGEVLLGLVVGLPGFASFFFIVASLLGSIGLWPSVTLALTVAIGLNLVLLLGLRRVATWDMRAERIER